MMQDQKLSATTSCGIQEDFKRFDQKNNITTRILWDEEIKKLEDVRKKNLIRYIKKGRAGYSHFDYAFSKGSLNFLEDIDYSVNICDQGANSWNNTNCTGLEKWQGDKKEVTQAIKKAAKIYGASAVGIAPLDRRWVFSHWFDPKTNESYPMVFSDEEESLHDLKKPILLENGTRVIPASLKTVIVFLFEIDDESLKYAPTILPHASGLEVYGKMSLATKSMAELIRNLGYEAIPSINCTALNIPLAIDAGLGEMGRNGKLINPSLGPKCRIAKVITDLPLEYNKPIDFGVIDFCESCRQCVKKCPVGAISSSPRSSIALDEMAQGGYLKWQVDHKKCFEYGSECGTNCNICLAVCPYNRGYKCTKGMLAAFNENNSLVDRLLDTLEDDTNQTKTDKQGDFWRTQL